MFCPLDAPIRDYAWGSSGVISGFRGLADSGKPEAEQWFGNHHQSQTVIKVAGHQHRFNEWLSASGAQFPLLVKLLAVEQPLSIQAHPGAQQAQEGFAAEEKRRVPEEQRTYRDASAKPELLIALSAQFGALVGFVDEETVERRLELWRGAGLDAGVCDLLVTKLVGLPAEGISWVLGNGPEVQHSLGAIQRWVAAMAEGVESAVGDQGELKLLRELCSLYPKDPGVLVSVLMHHVVLQRGEAVFVDAGVVHAYLRGFGLEVMLPSDNVVRAGLTPKHRNPAEFLTIADMCATSKPPIVRPRESGSSGRYEGFSAHFTVTHVTEPDTVALGGSSAVVVVEDGTGILAGKVSEKGAVAGDILYITPEEGAITTTVTGSVWVVHPTH